jgi:hypothetical protein
MTSGEERVELLVDMLARAWVPDSANADDMVRERCATYVALPRESKMGKLGGEPPRPIRRRPHDSVKATEVDDPEHSRRRRIR